MIGGWSLTLRDLCGTPVPGALRTWQGGRVHVPQPLALQEHPEGQQERLTSFSCRESSRRRPSLPSAGQTVYLALFIWAALPASACAGLWSALSPARPMPGPLLLIGLDGCAGLEGPGAPPDAKGGPAVCSGPGQHPIPMPAGQSRAPRAGGGQQGPGEGRWGPGHQEGLCCCVSWCGGLAWAQSEAQAGPLSWAGPFRSWRPLPDVGVGCDTPWVFRCSLSW